MIEPNQTSWLARWIAGTVLVALVSIASAARAAAPAQAPDRTPAQALAEDAWKLMAGQRYAEACPMLEESQRQEPNPEIELAVADCYDKAGKTATAWTKFGEIAGAASRAGDTKRAKDANERAAALLPRLCSITVMVSNPVSGLVVKRDGVRMPRTTWGTKVFVDPGKHLIEARAPYHKPWRMAVEIEQPGATVQVPIVGLQPLPQAPPPPLGKAQAPRAQAPRAQAPRAQAPRAQAPRAQAPRAQAPRAQAPRAQAPRAQAPRAQAPRAQAPRAQPSKAQPPRAQPPQAQPPAPSPAVAAAQGPADRAQRRRTQQRTWALVSAGVGVVGLGVGTALALSAKSTYQQADVFCDAANRCSDPQGVNLRQDAISRANLANIPFAVGVAGIGLGVTLWFTAPSVQRLPATTGLSVTPTEVALKGTF